MAISNLEKYRDDLNDLIREGGLVSMPVYLVTCTDLPFRCHH